MKITKFEKRINAILEEYSIEEVLEEFDIDPIDVFAMLYEAGMIDQDLLDNLTPTGAFL